MKIYQTDHNNTEKDTTENQEFSPYHTTTLIGKMIS